MNPPNDMYGFHSTSTPIPLTAQLASSSTPSGPTPTSTPRAAPMNNNMQISTPGPYSSFFSGNTNNSGLLTPFTVVSSLHTSNSLNDQNNHNINNTTGHDGGTMPGAQSGILSSSSLAAMPGFMSTMLMQPPNNLAPPTLSQQNSNVNTNNNNTQLQPLQQQQHSRPQQQSSQQSHNKQLQQQQQQQLLQQQNIGTNLHQLRGHTNTHGLLFGSVTPSPLGTRSGLFNDNTYAAYPANTPDSHTSNLLGGGGGGPGGGGGIPAPAMSTTGSATGSTTGLLANPLGPLASGIIPASTLHGGNGSHTLVGADVPSHMYHGTTNPSMSGPQTTSSLTTGQIHGTPLHTHTMPSQQNRVHHHHFLGQSATSVPRQQNDNTIQRSVTTSMHSSSLNTNTLSQPSSGLVMGGFGSNPLNSSGGVLSTKKATIVNQKRKTKRTTTSTANASTPYIYSNIQTTDLYQTCKLMGSDYLLENGQYIRVQPILCACVSKSIYTHLNTPIPPDFANTPMPSHHKCLIHKELESRQEERDNIIRTLLQDHVVAYNNRLNITGYTHEQLATDPQLQVYNPATMANDTSIASHGPVSVLNPTGPEVYITTAQVDHAMAALQHSQLVQPLRLPSVSSSTAHECMASYLTEPSVTLMSRAGATIQQHGDQQEAVVPVQTDVCPLDDKNMISLEGFSPSDYDSYLPLLEKASQAPAYRPCLTLTQLHCIAKPSYAKADLRRRDIKREDNTEIREDCFLTQYIVHKNGSRMPLSTHKTIHDIEKVMNMTSSDRLLIQRYQLIIPVLVVIDDILPPDLRSPVLDIHLRGLVRAYMIQLTLSQSIVSGAADIRGGQVWMSKWLNLNSASAQVKTNVSELYENEDRLRRWLRTKQPIFIPLSCLEASQVSPITPSGSGAENTTTNADGTVTPTSNDNTTNTNNTGQVTSLSSSSSSDKIGQSMNDTQQPTMNRVASSSSQNGSMPLTLSGGKTPHGLLPLDVPIELSHTGSFHNHSSNTNQSDSGNSTNANMETHLAKRQRTQLQISSSQSSSSQQPTVVSPSSSQQQQQQQQRQQQPSSIYAVAAQPSGDIPLPQADLNDIPNVLPSSVTGTSKTGIVVKLQNKSLALIKTIPNMDTFTYKHSNTISLAQQQRQLILHHVLQMQHQAKLSNPHSIMKFLLDVLGSVRYIFDFGGELLLNTVYKRIPYKDTLVTSPSNSTIPLSVDNSIPTSVYGVERPLSPTYGGDRPLSPQFVNNNHNNTSMSPLMNTLSTSGMETTLLTPYQQFRDTFGNEGNNNIHNDDRIQNDVSSSSSSYKKQQQPQKQSQQQPQPGPYQYTLFNMNCPILSTVLTMFQDLVYHHHGELNVDITYYEKLKEQIKTSSSSNNNNTTADTSSSSSSSLLTLDNFPPPRPITLVLNPPLLSHAFAYNVARLRQRYKIAEDAKNAANSTPTDASSGTGKTDTTTNTANDSNTKHMPSNTLSVLSLIPTPSYYMLTSYDLSELVKAVNAISTVATHDKSGKSIPIVVIPPFTLQMNGQIQLLPAHLVSFDSTAPIFVCISIEEHVPQQMPSLSQYCAFVVPLHSIDKPIHNNEYTQNIRLIHSNITDLVGDLCNYQAFARLLDVSSGLEGIIEESDNAIAAQISAEITAQNERNNNINHLGPSQEVLDRLRDNNNNNKRPRQLQQQQGTSTQPSQRNPLSSDIQHNTTLSPSSQYQQQQQHRNSFSQHTHMGQMQQQHGNPTPGQTVLSTTNRSNGGGGNQMHNNNINMQQQQQQQYRNNNILSPLQGHHQINHMNSPNNGINNNNTAYSNNDPTSTSSLMTSIAPNTAASNHNNNHIMMSSTPLPIVTGVNNNNNNNNNRNDNNNSTSSGIFGSPFNSLTQTPGSFSYQLGGTQTPLSTTVMLGVNSNSTASTLLSQHNATMQDSMGLQQQQPQQNTNNNGKIARVNPAKVIGTNKFKQK